MDRKQQMDDQQEDHEAVSYHMLFSGGKPMVSQRGPLTGYNSVHQETDLSKMVVEDSARKSRAKVGDILGHLCSESDTRTAQFHQGAGAKTFDLSSKTMASAAHETQPLVGEGIQITESDIVQIGGGSFAQHAQSVASPHVPIQTLDKQRDNDTMYRGNRAEASAQFKGRSKSNIDQGPTDQVSKGPKAMLSQNYRAGEQIMNRKQAYITSEDGNKNSGNSPFKPLQFRKGGTSMAHSLKPQQRTGHEVNGAEPGLSLKRTLRAEEAVVAPGNGWLLMSEGEVPDNRQRLPHGLQKGVSLRSPEDQVARHLSAFKDRGPIYFDQARFPRVAGVGKLIGTSMVATGFRSNEKLEELSVTANTTGVLDPGMSKLPELKAWKKSTQNGLEPAQAHYETPIKPAAQITQEIYQAQLAASASLLSLSSASRIDVHSRRIVPDTRSVSRTRMQATERKPTDRRSPSTTVDHTGLSLAPISIVNRPGAENAVQGYDLQKKQTRPAAQSNFTFIRTRRPQLSSNEHVTDGLPFGQFNIVNSANAAGNVSLQPSIDPQRAIQHKQMPMKTKSKMQQPRYADLRVHHASASENSLGRSTGKLTRDEKSRDSGVSGAQPEFSLERAKVVPIVTSGESMLMADNSIGSLDQRKASLLALAPIDDSTAERSRPRDEEEERPTTSFFEQDNEPVASSNDNGSEDEIDTDSKLEDAHDEGDQRLEEFSEHAHDEEEEEIFSTSSDRSVKKDQAITAPENVDKDNVATEGEQEEPVRTPTPPLRSPPRKRGQWLLTSGVAVGDKKIKGFQGGLKFKIIKSSHFITRSEGVKKALNHELNEKIKKDNALGPQHIGTLPFSFYPQGLKNTVSSLLQSYVPPQPAHIVDKSDRPVPYGKQLTENALMSKKGMQRFNEAFVDFTRTEIKEAHMDIGGTEKLLQLVKRRQMASQSIKDAFRVEGSAFSLWKKLHAPELFAWAAHTGKFAKVEEQSQVNHTSSAAALRHHLVHPCYQKFQRFRLEQIDSMVHRYRPFADYNLFRARATLDKTKVLGVAAEQKLYALVGSPKPTDAKQADQLSEKGKEVDVMSQEEPRTWRLKDSVRALKEEGQKQYYRLQRWRHSLINQENVALEPARRPVYLGLVSPSQHAGTFIYKKDYEMMSLLETRFFQAPAAHRRIGSAHRLNGAGPSKALLGLGASMKKSSAQIATATKAAAASNNREQVANSQLLSRRLSNERLQQLPEPPESVISTDQHLTENIENVRRNTELAQSNEDFSAMRSHMSTPHTGVPERSSRDQGKRSSRQHMAPLCPDRTKTGGSALVGAPGRPNRMITGPKPKGLATTFEPIMVPSFGNGARDINAHAQSSFIRHGPSSALGAGPPRRKNTQRAKDLVQSHAQQLVNSSAQLLSSQASKDQSKRQNQQRATLVRNISQAPRGSAVQQPTTSVTPAFWQPGANGQVGNQLRQTSNEVSEVPTPYDNELMRLAQFYRQANRQKSIIYHQQSNSQSNKSQQVAAPESVRYGPATPARSQHTRGSNVPNTGVEVCEPPTFIYGCKMVNSNPSQTGGNGQNTQHPPSRSYQRIKRAAPSNQSKSQQNKPSVSNSVNSSSNPKRLMSNSDISKMGHNVISHKDGSIKVDQQGQKKLSKTMKKSSKDKAADALVAAIKVQQQYQQMQQGQIENFLLLPNIMGKIGPKNPSTYQYKVHRRS